jgi:antitoxin component of MazEF toxin-antitoxin module
MMTLIVQSSSEDVISLPAWLMNILNLHEGDEIKTIIEGQTLRITPLDQFLALRGALKNDQEFDTALEFLNQAWQEWTVAGSV